MACQQLSFKFMKDNNFLVLPEKKVEEKIHVTEFLKRKKEDGKKIEVCSK